MYLYKYIYLISVDLNSSLVGLKLFLQVTVLLAVVGYLGWALVRVTCVHTYMYLQQLLFIEVRAMIEACIVQRNLDFSLKVGIPLH